MPSPTYGEVSMQTIASIIAQKTAQAEPGEFELVIGTDSQNFDKTKIVVVVALAAGATWLSFRMSVHFYKKRQNGAYA